MKKSGNINADLIHQILLNLYSTLRNSLPSSAPALSFILITAGLIAYKEVSLSLPAYSGFNRSGF